MLVDQMSERALAPTSWTGENAETELECLQAIRALRLRWLSGTRQLVIRHVDLPESGSRDDKYESYEAARVIEASEPKDAVAPKLQELRNAEPLLAHCAVM